MEIDPAAAHEIARAASAEMQARGASFDKKLLRYNQIVDRALAAPEGFSRALAAELDACDRNSPAYNKSGNPWPEVRHAHLPT